MSFPVNVVTKRVTAQYYDIHGNPAQGEIHFDISVVLISEDDDVAIIPRRIVGTLNGDGELDINLPATDQSIWQTEFTYKVTEYINSVAQRVYEISLPENQAEPISLLELSPASTPSTPSAYLSQAFADTRFVRNAGDAPALIVLGAAEPIPPDTPSGTVIIRKA